MAYGGAKAKERHPAQGKMLVRDRLRRLFDDGTLLEDGLLAGVRRNLPEGEQAAFIQAKRDEYARDMNPYDPSDRFSFESVVDPDHLRKDLIRRFDIFCGRSIPRIDRRNGVYPV